MEAVSYIFDNDCLFYSTREGFKRRKEENALEEDRISGLPDPLLLHILSFSQTKHAVRTTVLSKRWRCLWTSVPILDFQYRDIPNQFKSIKCMSPFVSFINHTLIFYQSPKIEKFRVRMDYKISFASDVDVWLLFATRKNVEELDLDFSDSRYIYSSDDDEAEDDDISCYALPLYMLTNSSLVTLKLNNCVIEHRRMICWKSLKVLSLTELSLSNDLIRDILSGSPSLELLELLDCHRYDFVDIKSGRLRKLVINVYNQHLPLDSYTELKISAPNIQSLEISGYLNIEKVSFINCSSLVDAKLNFRLPSFPPSEEYPKILIALLEKLSHVEDITLGSWCLQVLSVLEENAPPCPLFNWVRLRIGAQISHSELPGMARLLTVTPVLDTLVIDMIFNHVLEFELELIEPHDLEPGNYWSSQEKKLEASLLNLKTVKIANFCGSEIAIETISFMLKNARRLEKMIIQRAKWMIIQRAKWVYLPQEESLRVAERLLSFPRCSSAAVVLLS